MKNTVCFTSQIRNRLKELQKENNYTLEDIYFKTKIHPNTYKNWFRAEGTAGSVKTFKDKHIHKLAELYDCTTDYLICRSNNKTTNRFGNSLLHPVEFQTGNKLSELVKYLQNNEEIIILLHNLLVSAPEEVRKITINQLKTWNTEFKLYNLLYGNDTPIKDPFELLTVAMNPYSANITDAILSLASANFNFGKERYADALPKYLKIIYNTTKNTEFITKEALEKILQLESIWEEYPSALKEIFSKNYKKILLEEQKKLEKRKKLEEQKTPEERKKLEEQRTLEEQKRLEDPIERAINNQDFSVLPKEYYKSIYKYFKNNGIELQNLKDYLETLY